MRTTLWLAGFAGLVTFTGCAVEDVIVDTGGAGLDTGTVVDEPRERPDDGESEPGSDPEDDDGAEETDEPLTIDPLTAPPGVTTLVFVEGAGLDDVVQIDLYGEPDAELATWAPDGPGRLVLVVEVASGSPSGDVLVVLEHSDGGVSRPEAALVVP